jgi:superfamily II DNA or RNA helicase
MSKKPNFFRQPMIAAAWQFLDISKLKKYDGKVLKQHDWQAECHQQFFKSEKKHFILNAPTGSGKTNETCWVVWQKLQANPKMKAIIVVPSLVVGDGFVEAKELACFDDANLVSWKPDVNLCLGKNSETSNIKTILEFLRKRPVSRTDFNFNVLVCSQVSLVNAFFEDQKNESKSFHDLFIAIDEAHHIDYDANDLGRFTKYVYDNPEQNIQIMAITATMFRTNKSAIIPNQYKENFERYNLAYDRYLKTCKHLRTISYDFLLCKNTYEDALWSCFKAGVPKTFVFLPFPGGQFTLGRGQDVQVAKKLDVHAILCAIAQSKNPTIKYEEGLTLVKRGSQWIRVLDLVDRDEQEERKILLKVANKDRDYLDVTIALRMLVEGADWKWGENEIIIGPRNSAVTLLQMVGRVLRDVEGKPHASINHIVPFGADNVTKDQCEDYLKGLMLAMMMEDAFLMPRLRPGRPEDSLGDLLDGDIDSAKEIFGSLVSEWSRYCENRPGDENDEVAFKEMAEGILEDFELPNWEMVAEKVWDICIYQAVKKQRKKTIQENPQVQLKLDYIKVDEIDFEQLEDVSMLDAFRGLRGNDMVAGLEMFKLAYGEHPLERAKRRLDEIKARYGTVENLFSRA